MAERESCFLQKLQSTCPCLFLVLIAYMHVPGPVVADWPSRIGPIPGVGSGVNLLKTYGWRPEGVFLSEHNLAIIAEWKGDKKQMRGTSHPVCVDINHSSHNVLCVRYHLSVFQRDWHDSLYFFCVPWTLTHCWTHSCCPILIELKYVEMIESQETVEIFLSPEASQVREDKSTSLGGRGGNYQWHGGFVEVSWGGKKSIKIKESHTFCVRRDIEMLSEVTWWAFQCLELLLSEWDIYHMGQRNDSQEGDMGQSCLKVW